MDYLTFSFIARASELEYDARHEIDLCSLSNVALAVRPL